LGDKAPQKTNAALPDEHWPGAKDITTNTNANVTGSNLNGMF
jgi:hypothetical protein